MPERLVIIPTYNEKENIQAIVREVLSLPDEFHILVVDDNSPDGTAKIVKGLQKEYGEKLHLLERPGKQGLGTAYIAGFKEGLSKGYEYIFEMDADFSHNPKDLIRLYNACAVDGANMSIGSRYVKGGSVKNWGWHRILLSYFASLYVEVILWMGIRDTTAGFVCYHRKVLETINLDEVKFIGYAFQIEMKYRALKRGFKLKEVPISFVDRREGKSKMSGTIFKEALWGVVSMRFLKIS